MPVYYYNGGSVSPYNTGGVSLSQAYNIQGTELLSVFDNLPNSGYTFSDGVQTYSTKLMFNFGTTEFQSVVYGGSKYYRASTNSTVYPYDASLSALSTITLPSTAGHKNDGCYYDGKIYWLDGTASASKMLYVWNISANAITSVTLPIENNENGSILVVAGICVAEDGYLYLVSRDQYNNSDIDHQEGDVMCVYRYNIADNTVELVASYPWDCVYVQGATFFNGKMYVSCNTQTTGSASNYTGITIKIIETQSWEITSVLTCEGNFEPQGCDHIVLSDGTVYVWTGLSKYGTTDKVITFAAL